MIRRVLYNINVLLRYLSILASMTNTSSSCVIKVGTSVAIALTMIVTSINSAKADGMETPTSDKAPIDLVCDTIPHSQVSNSSLDGSHNGMQVEISDSRDKVKSYTDKSVLLPASLAYYQTEDRSSGNTRLKGTQTIIIDNLSKLKLVINLGAEIDPKKIAQIEAAIKAGTILEQKTVFALIVMYDIERPKVILRDKINPCVYDTVRSEIDHYYQGFIDKERKGKYSIVILEVEQNLVNVEAEGNISGGLIKAWKKLIPGQLETEGNLSIDYSKNIYFLDAIVSEEIEMPSSSDPLYLKKLEENFKLAKHSFVSENFVPLCDVKENFEQTIKSAVCQEETFYSDNTVKTLLTQIEKSSNNFGDSTVQESENDILSNKDSNRTWWSKIWD
jgi:hypothetical protein